MSSRPEQGSSREDLLKRQLPQIPPTEAGGSNRQERMQSLREQHQRMHQRRQGQYPLEQKEEYYEAEIKEKESNYALPFEVIHGRSHSLDTHLENSQNHSKGGSIISSCSVDPYHHYMNYKEIQHHVAQRGHHPPVGFKSSLPPHGVPLPEPPATNYYEYGHHLRRTAQNPEICSNSLPRGSRGSDRSLPPHPQAAKPYFLQEGMHDHDTYGRMNANHFYPNNNNKLYSHIVPGSKV